MEISTIFFKHGVPTTRYPVGYNYFHVREDFRKIASYFISKLDRVIKYKNINLICTGASGTITASIFGEVLLSTEAVGNVRIIDIKKQGISAHGNSLTIDMFYKDNFDNFNIIIDDFISSGDTVCYILKELERNRIYYSQVSDNIIDKNLKINAGVFTGTVFGGTVNELNCDYLFNL